MAPPISLREPEEIVSGDSLIFQRNLPDYPASQGWSLDYEIRGGTQAISFQSVAAGDSHSINVLPPVTATWLPGSYVMAGYAVNVSGERHQIFYSALQIWENKQAATGDAPEKTFAQKMLEQIELVLLAKAGHDLSASQLGDTKFQFLTPEQLRMEHGYWRSVRIQEVARENAKLGRPTGNKIRPRVNVFPSGPVFGSQWPTGYGGW